MINLYLSFKCSLKHLKDKEKRKWIIDKGEKMAFCSTELSHTFPLLL